MQFENSEALCEYIAGQTDTVVLSFSRGKDSICSWLHLRRYFRRVIPVHMYALPGLSFIEESLDYLENFFGQKIYSLPHPGLYRQLIAMVFQSPSRLRIIDRLELVEYELDDVFDIVKLKEGLPLETWTAVGVTINDNLTRRSSINRYGPINESRNQFYPIYDWPRKRITAEIGKSGVRLPKEYNLFGRSVGGLDYRFIKPIHDHYPADYELIKEWFPMVELELRRYEWRAKALAERGG